MKTAKSRRREKAIKKQRQTCFDGVAGPARLTAKRCLSVIIAALGDRFSLDLPVHVIGLLLFCYNDAHRVDLIKRDDVVFMKNNVFAFFTAAHGGRKYDLFRFYLRVVCSYAQKLRLHMFQLFLK